MAIKIKVFMWEGTVSSVLTDSNEEVEVEFIDAYTKRDYAELGTASDEDAAEKYEEECRTNGFRDADFEIGSYRDPEEEDEDDEEDDEDSQDLDL